MVTLATLYNDFKTLIKQNFYDKDETDDLLDEKQATLVSGTNIKTINNNSLLGSGNISISGSGIVDASLDTSSTNPVQNQAIATEINSLNNSITNINNRVKSGKVTGITVQKQNVASYTITHNLGRPNVPVVTLNLGNSNSYAWANTQATVYDITNNDFKVKIYNNTTSNGNFSFNWVVVATD